MKRKHIWLFLAAAWSILIFVKSHKPAFESSEESSLVAMFINQAIASIFGAGKFIVSDNMVRKTAHFLEYFVLSFLLFKAYLNTEKVVKTFYLATVTSVIYAISDEIHQYFIP